jgi:amino acid adenylation domain-containing protein/non-ribosomal peptide synthase protein (TIGR01720 family)
MKEVKIESARLTNLGEIEESYSLSPLQQGMLFHSLYAGQSGVDIEQMFCALHEDLDVPAFQTAWQQVLARHSVLRTAFRWIGLDEPLQEVHPYVSIPLEMHDWRGLTPNDRALRLRNYLDVDRRKGFKLDEVPLMRLALYRLDEADYQLLWTFHHALLDGRSFPLVLKDVFTFYEANRQALDLKLPRPRPYRDYIEWLQQQDLSKAESFWRRALASFVVPTPLPAAHAILENHQEQRFGEQEIRLSEELTAALQSLAGENGLTVNTIIQGSWALLLNRYSGDEDVVFGATRACRRSALEGADSMIGLFINTLPVRACVAPDALLLPWLKELRAQSVDLRAFEHTPLSKVQAWSDVPKGTPLFESILVFDKHRLNTLLRSQGGAWKHREFRYTGQTNYPMRVSVFLEKELSLNIQYDRFRFDDAAMARLGGHLEALLGEIAANPFRPLSAYSLLTAAERKQILEEWSSGQTEVQANYCVHQIFEAHAERTPENIAIECEGKRLTYAELNSRSNQLAQYLKRLGVGPEAIIGLHLERSVDLIVGLLGILKAGAAYLPLDMTLPKQRLKFMLQDARSPFVVTTQDLIGNLEGCGSKPICLDTDRSIIGEQSTENVASQTSQSNPVYVIYTSGSTGQPKGVVVEHRQLVNYVSAISKKLMLPAGSSFALVSTIAADLGNTVVFPSLCSAGCLHLVEKERATDPEALADYFRLHPVDCLKIVPSHLAALLSASSPADILPKQRLVLGGEACSWRLIERIRELAPDCRVLNHYGPTEATIGAITYGVDQRDAGHFSKTIPLGRPLSNMQMYVLDTNMQPVPIGVPGELHLAGDGLVRGYLNAPELTAEKFVPNPFSTMPGNRLYKTGDLARYLPSGDVEFLGRIDEQVKIRGYRVEPKEVEAALAEQPSVKECVVIVREEKPDDKRLVAYVVPSPDQNLDVGELRKVLKKSLPDYMSPSAFVILDRLPLTANGKLDRRALPQPDQMRTEIEKSFVAPATPVQELLAKIWAQVLGLERVGIHDNFFELGGDSILSIQIMARASQAGLRLTTRQLFQNQTISELAAGARRIAAIETEQGLVTGFVPLSPIQHWFFEWDLPELERYSQTVLVETQPDFDSSLLEIVFKELAAHHDALRLRYLRDEAGWHQVNAGLDQVIPFRPFDLSQLSETDQQAKIKEITLDLHASLNLANGPLVQIAYIKQGPVNPGLLLIVIHHLVIDGISWRVLLEDLQTAYEQLRHGEPVKLMRKTTSFKCWAEQLVEHVRSRAPEQELSYWLAESRSKIKGLPVDYSRKENTTASTESVSISLSEEETRALLQDVPKAYHTQINEVLLTALAQTLAEYSGQHRILVDLHGHGREDVIAGVDLSRTVGWFTTIFPMLLEVDTGSSPGDALPLIKEQLRATPNRGIGYGLLRYMCRDAEFVGKLRDLPQAEVKFNYLGQFDQVFTESSPLKLARGFRGPEHSVRVMQHYLLDIVGVITESRLRLFWTYDEKIHRRATIERLAECFMESVRSLIAACEQPEAENYTPSDFPLAGLDQQTLNRLTFEIDQLDQLEEHSS